MKYISRKARIVITISVTVVLFCAGVFFYLFTSGNLNSDSVSSKDHLAINSKLPSSKTMRFLSHEIKLRVPVNRHEQEVGLGNVSYLSKDEGMLFVFNVPAQYAFWMKDMLIPIDVIWLQRTGNMLVDGEYKVVGIEERISPETYPAIFTAPVPVDAFIELRSGRLNELGLGRGELISIY